MKRNPNCSSMHFGSESRPLRRILLGGLTMLLGLGGFGCNGPIGPLPGGRLTGEEGDSGFDWRGFSGSELAQLETNPEDPYSINIWFVVVDGTGFLSTSLLRGPSEPDRREWVANVTADPRIRIRVGGVVIPSQLEVVQDPVLRGRVFKAYLEKYPALDPTRERDTRFYRIKSRDSTS